MAEGSDVTIRYSFLPTESSIRESAEKMINGLDKATLKNMSKWNTEGLYSKKTFEQMQGNINKSASSIKKSVYGLEKAFTDIFRVLSPRVQWATKLKSGESLAGGIGGEAAAGGGMASLLGLVAAIAAAVVIISAFFEAVGPLIKMVFKMLSAVILILLMPFLKRIMPLLAGFFKWLIDIAKGISDTLDKAMSGDIGSILALWLGSVIFAIAGPLGLMLMPAIVELIKSALQIIKTIDFGAMLKEIIPTITSGLKGAIDFIGTTIFGKETWTAIKDAVAYISTIFDKKGIWSAIKAAIDFIGTTVFGTDLWNLIKQAIVDVKDIMVDSVVLLDEMYAKILSKWNEIVGWIPGMYISQYSGISSGVSSKNLKTASDMLNALGNIGKTTSSAKALTTAADFGAGKKTFGDFISRPGMGVQSFSPSDTIIGTKGGMGGGNITNNLYVSAGVDKNEFRKILSDFNREQARELRMRTSYSAGVYA